MRNNHVISKIISTALMIAFGIVIAFAPVNSAKADSNEYTVSSDEIEALKTAPVNSEDFNAYYYYIYNPDIQVVYGANADLLYIHWSLMGKSEGRVAINLEPLLQQQISQIVPIS